ncbi:MAG: branched-chain amino acid ABC transporter permease [Rubrivivax sp.]
MLALALAAPLVFYPVLLMKLMCYALLAASFNLLLGYTGLLSFGHAAFFGTAAYLTGYVLKTWSLDPILGILFGTACAALLGLVVGLLSIRRTGIYFSMVTLALAQMVFFFYLQARFTGGEDGLQGVPRGTVLGLLDLNDNTNLYYFVLAIFVLGFWLIYRTVNSPFGHILTAIRENEPRAISLSYDVNRFKLLAFVLSAGLAGLAGATKVLVFQLASLNDVSWHLSGEVVLMTLVGGMGTIWGPIVGGAAIVLVQNELADKVGSLIGVIMGAIFALCVLLFRRGLMGEIERLRDRLVGTAAKTGGR